MLYMCVWAFWYNREKEKINNCCFFSCIFIWNIKICGKMCVWCSFCLFVFCLSEIWNFDLFLLNYIFMFFYCFIVSPSLLLLFWIISFNLVFLCIWVCFYKNKPRPIEIPFLVLIDKGKRVCYVWKKKTTIKWNLINKQKKKKFNIIFGIEYFQQTAIYPLENCLCI